MGTYNETTKMEAITCGGCGILFGLTEEHGNILRKTHEGFYCPKGCSISYSAKSKEEKLQDKIEELRVQNQRQEKHNKHLKSRLTSEKNSKKAIKGHVTRLKKQMGKTQ